MTPQQIFGSALRLLALWLAIRSVGYLLTVPAILSKVRMDDGNVYSYVFGIAYLLAAAVLWFFPMWIAHNIVPRTQFENRINIQPLEAARVGCALIGLWIFATVLPKLVWFFFRAVVFYSNESSFQMLTQDDKLSFAVSVFEVIFSLVLIFRSSAFAKLVVREQTSGVPQNANQPEL